MYQRLLRTYHRSVKRLAKKGKFKVDGARGKGPARQHMPAGDKIKLRRRLGRRVKHSNELGWGLLGGGVLIAVFGLAAQGKGVGFDIDKWPIPEAFFACLILGALMAMGGLVALISRRNPDERYEHGAVEHYDNDTKQPEPETPDAGDQSGTRNR